MAISELGRLTSIERTAKLVAALLAGRDLTRSDLTALLGVRVAAIDRQLEAIGRHLPLVREKRRGRIHVRVDRSRVAGGGERTPIATMIAACVGASLSRLFEGTSYEKGMRDLVQYVSREAIHPERFQDYRRQFVFLVRGGEKSLPEKEELLEEVVDALQRRHGLQIRYRAFDGRRQSLRIEPLSLAVYDHQLYVIGRPRGREPHPYRFSRIDAAESVGGTFQYPDKDRYDPERVFADSFGIFVDAKYPVSSRSAWPAGGPRSCAATAGTARRKRSCAAAGSTSVCACVSAPRWSPGSSLSVPTSASSGPLRSASASRGSPARWPRPTAPEGAVTPRRVPPRGGSPRRSSQSCRRSSSSPAGPAKRAGSPRDRRHCSAVRRSRRRTASPAGIPRAPAP